MILKKTLEELTFLGGILFYILFLVFLFIFGKQESFPQLLLSLLIIYFLTFTIRIFYFKPRPKKIKHKNFLQKLDASSFPSVHAARATVIFVFLLISYLPPVFYILFFSSLYFLVLYSRTYLLKHDAIDLLGGVLIGLVSLISIILV